MKVLPITVLALVFMFGCSEETEKRKPSFSKEDLTGSWEYSFVQRQKEGEVGVLIGFRHTLKM